jgi:hypothetical protein
MNGYKAVGGIVIAVALIGASGAFGAKLTTESETITVDFVDTATPECAKGKAVSGGFAAEDSDVTVLRSTKASRASWTVEARSEDGATDLTAYVHCVKKGKNPATSSATLSVDGGEIGTVTATCEAGTKAVSGGFFGETGILIAPAVLIHESRKSGGRGWTVSAGNYGLVSGELIAYVNCRKGKGLKSRSKTTQVEGEAGDVNPTGSVTAKCKKGSTAVSGGFSGEVDASFVSSPPDGAGVRAFTSRREGGRKWEAVAANFGDGNGSLTNYVYCEKKPKKK